MANQSKKFYAGEKSFLKKLNLLTLNFRDALEKEFREESFNSSLPIIRLSFLAGFIYYGAFTILDVINLHEFLPELLVLRLAIVEPTIIAILLLSYTKGFKKWWQPGIAVSVIISGVAIAVMTMIPHEITSKSYYVGMILVLIYCYLLVRLRYLWASLAGFTIVITYMIILSFEPDISKEIKITNLFFLISANTLGIIAGYAIEYLTRRSFYFSHLLKIESEKVKKANLELDAKVKQKTAELERDLELRKKTEKQLIIAKEKAEESDRLKSAFLANMSHEIRTPMNGIMGFANLLDKPDINPDTIHKYTAIIRKSGNRMLDTLNDLIDISRIEAGLVEVHLTEENINQHLEDHLEFFLPEAGHKGIELKLTSKLEAKDQLISTDRDKFNSIITNLLKNAIKYTESGSVKFGADLIDKKNSKYLECFVTDTGIGIPDNLIDKIFDRFTREEGTNEFLYEGAGLGLSITKSYVTMLGGDITVSSTIKKGTSFRVILPVSN